MGWRFIDHRALLPPAVEVPAWYDLASGFIGTAFTVDEFRMDAANAPLAMEGEDDAIIAIAHEQAHFIQAICTPFLLSWSDNWLNLASAPLREMGPDLGSYGLRAGLAKWQNPKVVSEANRHLDKLFQPGLLGVDVFMLMESHATFLEVRAHTTATEPHQLLDYLNNNAPGAAYRRAYDIVRLWCGDKIAHRAFHAIFLAAMSTSDPASAFDRLVFRCAETHGEDLERFLDDCGEAWFLALEMCHTTRRLGPHRDTFAALAKSWVEDLSPRRLVRDPRTFGRFPHSPVVVFGADDAHRFGVHPGSLAHLNLDLEDPEVFAAFTWDFSVAAISQNMIRGRTLAIESSLLDDGYTWLENLDGSGYALEVSVDNWGAKTSGPRSLVNDAISNDAGRLIEAISVLASSTSANEEATPSHETPLGYIPIQLGRRLLLTFDTVDEREVWEIPEVRQFIRLLSAKVPWLPALLHYPRHVDILFIWFASLAPESMRGETGLTSLNSADANFSSALENFIDTVFRQVRTGVDPSPLVTATLAQLMVSHLGGGTPTGAPPG